MCARELHKYLTHTLEVILESFVYTTLVSSTVGFHSGGPQTLDINVGEAVTVHFDFVQIPTGQSTEVPSSVRPQIPGLSITSLH